MKFTIDRYRIRIGGLRLYRNLGCVGWMTEHFGWDCFLRPYPGMFWRTRSRRHWFNFLTLRHHADKG